MRKLQELFRLNTSDIPITGCWMWMNGFNGHVDGGGRDFYAQTKIFGTRLMAHRVAYELFVGPIPDGLTLDHLCKHAWCVNPGHLEAVTGAENTLRGDNPAAINARLKVCRKGHEFTKRDERGNRRCQRCSNDRTRRHRAKMQQRVAVAEREKP